MNQQAKYEKHLSELKESLKQQTDANVSLRSELGKKEAIVDELDKSLKAVKNFLNAKI